MLFRSGAGGGGGGNSWGETGLGRMFGSEVGGQVSWLLPAALALLVAGLVALGRAPRTDLRRGALLTWGSWLVVTALTFSFMAGIFHAYYTVALAPAIAALVGIGGGLLWARRGSLWARIVLALTVLGTALWSFVLLDRSADFLPWLRWVVLAGGLVAGLGLLVVDRVGRVLVAAVLAVGVLAGLGGPAAYAVQTAATAHTGSIPTAGPTVAGGTGFGGARGGGGGFPGGGGGGGGGGQLGTPPTGGQAGGGQGFTPPGGTTGGAPTAGGRTGGGMSGLLDATDASDEVVAALTEDADSYTWVAAAIGSNNAAGYQLATEEPVMPIGGFNGSDPSPTLAEFQEYVADGDIHWFIASSTGANGSSGSNASAEIASWVEQNFTAQTVDGVTLYDLSSAAG